jgi:outer membrane protein assembly factor BamB
MEGPLIATSIILFNLPSIGAGALGEQTSDNQIEVVWRHVLSTGALPLGCRGTPAIGNDGTIYVPAGNFLYALNPDGSEKWKLGKESGLASLEDVAIDDNGTIYAGSNVLCAFTSDGSLKWKIPDREGFRVSSIAIDEGGLMYFIRHHSLCAADAEGTVKWERKAEAEAEDSFAPVIGPDGTIYVQGMKRGYGLMRAFGPDGMLKWTFKMDRFSSLSPASTDDLGNIYFGELSANLHMLDSSGRLRWIFKTEGTVRSAPAIGPDRTIYFGCADGSFYAVNPNGELKWKFHTNGPIYSAPAIDSQGNIYFASRDRNFYCLDSNGTPKRITAVTAGYGNPIIGAEGTIYLVDVGYLYAIRGFAPAAAGPWPMKRHDAQGTGRVPFRDMSASSVGAEK